MIARGELSRDKHFAMVHYKLTYFPLRGAAEHIRQIFAAAGQEFEDVRIPREEWPHLHKDKCPFGQLPVLEVDGQQLPQSYAISRFLAREFNLAGQNEWEEALVDSLADQFKDLKEEVRPYFIVSVGFGEGDLEQLKKDVLLPAVNKSFAFFTNFIRNNRSGFLVGDHLTWVDILLAENVANLATKAPEILDSFPEIVAHLDKIHSIPSIKHWRETRPKTPF